MTGVAARLRSSALARAALVALVVAGLVPPFKAGHVLGVSGAGAGSLLFGCLLWAAAGAVFGIASSGLNLVWPVRLLRATDDIPAVTRPAALAGGALAGLLIVLVLGRAASAAAALGALAALTPEFRVASRVSARLGDRLRPVSVTAALAAACLGAATGALLTPGIPAVLAAAAAVLAATIWRARAAMGGAAAVLLVFVASAVALAGVGSGSRAWAAGARKKSVTVSARQQWTPSGLEVKAGEVLRFSAHGSVTFLAGDKAAKADPDGYPARYSGCGGPGLCGALVGRVAGGTPFLIGAGTATSAPAAGPLELGVNDYDVSDDAGSFRVAITVEPAGTPLTPKGSGQATRSPATRPGSDSPAAPSPAGPAVLAALCAATGCFAGRKAATAARTSGELSAPAS